ncbi:histidine kinase [Clostridium sp. YIM B02555]|uniref:sensor histidine kinase n=1 Tax=Clostridium sp. YIM B02555 TaxID=2911968 RepID=UPI001EEF72A8|nr:histidine kinase [Clostridium sp. YIM B02555]
MNKNISILMFIMSLIGILYNMFFVSDAVSVIIRITCIIGILILEFLNYSFKVNEKIINFLQLISILIILKLGYYELNFFLPIILFKILNKKINILVSIGISSAIIFYIFKENVFYMITYAVVVNLYLFELKKQNEYKEKIKEFDREQRYEHHLMESKIRNLERYLEQNNVVTSLRERNFMAQKLHDHLGHRITSSIMQLEVTKETLGKNNELAYKYLTTSMTNLREGMDEIREVLRKVKPRDKVIGIENIKEQLLKFEYSTGVKTSLVIEGDTSRFTLKLWMAIQDNLSEALTNAAKYSTGDEIRLAIYIYNKIVRIEFRDNGKGYKTLKKGLGLRGIDERIQNLGGRVEYYNDNGFVINAVLNLEDKQ